MNRPLGVLRGAGSATRERLSAVTSQSERTLMLGTILLASAVSAATAYVLTQCYSVDVLSTLLSVPQDCWLDWGMSVGRHCFSDYSMVLTAGLQPNPFAYRMSVPFGNYQPFGTGYASALVPQLLFGLPAKWLGLPQLGLIGYLLALTIAVFSPAVWAARGADGLERVVVFVALGAAAIPVWAVIDRGNSSGFVVPIALVFLVALCRRRWGLVMVMVVLAALVKPQFAVLGVALLAARQWRWAGIGVAGVAITNFGAYLLWPRDFPETIAQSIHALSEASSWFPALTDGRNLSFARALLLVPDTVMASQTGGKIPDGFLAGPRSLIGYAVLVLVVVSLLALGRRIPPVMGGIVLLATASFFPPLSYYYYLVFALPVAALVVRDPDGSRGSGIFDQLGPDRGRRRAVGVCVSLAAALSIAQIAIPGQPFNVDIYGQLGARGVTGTTTLVNTTVTWAPFLWLIACAVIIVSYARRPAPRDSDEGPAREGTQDTAVSTGSCVCDPMPGESSPKGLA